MSVRPSFFLQRLSGIAEKLHKLHAQMSNLWTLCAALHESSPIRLRPLGLTSWTFIIKKAFSTKKAAVSSRYHGRLPFPSLVDLRGAQNRQFSWLGIFAQLRLPRDFSPVTGLTSMQRCSSLQWRDRSGIEPDSLLGKHREKHRVLGTAFSMRPKALFSTCFFIQFLFASHSIRTFIFCQR